jgi:hypothetical protein
VIPDNTWISGKNSEFTPDLQQQATGISPYILCSSPLMRVKIYFFMVNKKNVSEEEQSAARGYKKCLISRTNAKNYNFLFFTSGFTTHL